MDANILDENPCAAERARGISMNTKVVLKCVFWDDVCCSFRKSDKNVEMDRCYRCSHYLRWLAVMDEGDSRLMAEVDKEREKLETRIGVYKRVS